jgi:hypothetical protein
MRPELAAVAIAALLVGFGMATTRRDPDRGLALVALGVLVVIVDTVARCAGGRS